MRLVVADTASGSLAHAETTALVVERVSAIPADPGTAGVSIAAGGEIFVGAGRMVTTIDSAAGAAGLRWTVPADIRGMGISRDGNRVYIGGVDEVVWFDAGTGGLLGRAPIDGLSALRSIR